MSSLCDIMELYVSEEQLEKAFAATYIHSNGVLDLKSVIKPNGLHTGTWHYLPFDSIFATLQATEMWFPRELRSDGGIHVFDLMLRVRGALVVQGTHNLYSNWTEPSPFAAGYESVADLVTYLNEQADAIWKALYGD